MYQPMLYLHWKQIRFGLIPFMVASFGLPLLTVQGMGTVAGMDSSSLEAYRKTLETDPNHLSARAKLDRLVVSSNESP